MTREITPLLLCCALLAILLPTPPAWAQIAPGGTSEPPSPGKPPSFALPPIQTWQLDNGLKVAFVEDHRQPALWIDLALPAGSVYDPPEMVGLAEMAARLLNKGSQKYTASQIAEKTDRLGLTLSASAGRDYLFVSAQGLSIDARTLFSLLAEVTLHPLFAPAELAKERVLLINEIATNLSDPTFLATTALHRLIYGAHPYGNPPEGTPKTLQAITPEALKAFHEAHFVPNGSTLFVVGDISSRQAHRLAETFFASWKAAIQPTATPLPPIRSYKGPILLLDRPDAAQTAISIGTLAPPFSDPLRIPTEVAASVLGGGEFHSRLNMAIREKRGLAYFAYCRLEPHQLAGSFEATTLTKTASTGEVVQLALELIRQIAQQPIQPHELNITKNFMLGNFFIRAATPRGFLTALENAMLYGNGPQELVEYTQALQTATPEEAQKAIARLPLDRPIVVLVGNAQQVGSQIKPIGEVTVIPENRVDLLSPTLQSGSPPQPPTSPKTQQEDTQAQSLLNAAWQAHGGDALKSLKTLQMKGNGEFTPPGLATNNPLPISSFTFTFAAPNKMRMDLQTDFGTVSIGVPGQDKTPWFSLGAPQDAPEVVQQIASTTNLLQLLVNAEAGKLQVQSAPDLKTDAATLPGLSLTSANGSTIKLYLDPNTHLVQRIVAQGTKGGPDLMSIIGDYHTLKGLTLPQKIQVIQGSTKLMELKITSTELNPPVGEAIFMRPKAQDSP